MQTVLGSGIKKMKRRNSKLMEPTASSMMKDSSYRNSKKEITNMGQWINNLRGLKPPPKRSKTKSKKKNTYYLLLKVKNLMATNT